VNPILSDSETNYSSEKIMCRGIDTPAHTPGTLAHDVASIDKRVQRVKSCDGGGASSFPFSAVQKSQWQAKITSG